LYFVYVYDVVLTKLSLLTVQFIEVINSSRSLSHLLMSFFNAFFHNFWHTSGSL